MRDLLAIQTPENVRFELELAGVGSRAVAWTIDVLVMGVLLAITAIAVAPLGMLAGGFASAVYVVIAFLVQWGYGAASEWRFGGQTLGKRIVGLRVRQATGMPITFTQAAIRNLMRVVDLLPALYLSGGLCALLDARCRRLGDLAADTVVVRTRKSPRPSAIVAPIERFNSLIGDARVAHASQRVSARERDVMLALALRREQLPLPVRYALFAKLAGHLEAKLGVPRPSHLSEERYVLNLTALVLGMAGAPNERPSPAGETA